MHLIDTGGIRLTAVQVGELLDRSPTTVRRYSTEHGLRTVPGPGGQRRYLLGDVLEFVESGQIPGSDQIPQWCKSWGVVP